MTNADVKNAYPNRYYAAYDTTASQPTPVTGWYDTWDMSSVSAVPAASDMIAVSEADWNNTTTFRLPVGKGVKDGVIIDYTAPPTPIPLKTQAQSALTAARTYISNNFMMLNEPTPDDWVAYLKALMAIANGTDTTSTVLPTAPTASAPNNP